MREVNILEVRKLQIDILKKVTDFCEHEEIVYFLSSGTLLGAVRHGGFIPWDDDIDLMMPRGFYEKFIKLFSMEGLKLFTNSTVKNYNKPFIKVGNTKTLLLEEFHNKYDIGINIDIFPIDGFPADFNLIRKHVNRVMLYRNILFLKGVVISKERAFYKNILALITKPFLKLFTINYLIKRIDELGNKYSFNDSPKAGMIVWGYGMKEVCEKKMFEEVVKVSFENKNYSAPLKFDEYLSSLYGDYMKLPPADKQLTHHAFRAYYL